MASGDQATAEPHGSARARLLPGERLRELSRLRPTRAVLDAVGCWLVIAGAWALVGFGSPWWTPLAIPVIGSRYYALFIIGHDGLHRRVCDRTRWNDLVCDLLVFAPVGAITRINNRNHLLHHWNLATSKDPDRYRHACFNKYDRPGFLAFLSGASSLWTSARNVFAGSGAEGESARGADRSYTLRDVALILGWQAALISGLTWLVGWWGYPLLWLVPVAVFTALANNLRSFAEHSHPEADALADRHRLITFRSNPLERLFVAPFNMNYHAAHHLWVSIPYYNLPQADAELMRGPGAREIEVRGSYLGYLWRYWTALPLEDCRPGRS